MVNVRTWSQSGASLILDLLRYKRSSLHFKFISFSSRLITQCWDVCLLLNMTYHTSSSLCNANMLYCALSPQRFWKSNIKTRVVIEFRRQGVKTFGDRAYTVTSFFNRNNSNVFMKIEINSWRLGHQQSCYIHLFDSCIHPNLRHLQSTPP